MQNYKWDAVFACNGDWINRQLETSADKFPATFDYEDNAISVSGSFGTWNIVPGGSDRLLQFNTPIMKGSVVDKQSGQTFSLDGAVPLVQLQLSFIQMESDRSSQSLKFNCKKVGNKPGDTTPGAVTVLNPDTTGKINTGSLALDLLKSSLAKCFIASQNALDFVFANISLVPPQGASWLNLKQLAYAYQQDEDGVLGSLAVLGMFDDVDISNQDRVFDSALLRKEDQFGFVLAGSRFFEYILLPGMFRAYAGSSANQFRWNGATEIDNNGNISLNSVKVGLIYYSPYINNLTVRLEGSSIRTIAGGRCNITGLTDAYITFSITSLNPSRYNPLSRVISFASDPNKSITHSTHIPWWESLLGALTLGIMNVVIDAVSLAIEDAIAGAVGQTGVSIESMGARLISWPGQDAITPTDGGLEENFYFRGRL